MHLAFYLFWLICTYSYVFCTADTNGEEDTSTFITNAILNKTESKEVDRKLQGEFFRVFDKRVKYSQSRYYNKIGPQGPLWITGLERKLNFEKITPKTFFFDGNPRYREAIMEYKNFLMNSTNLGELLESAKKYRDEINLSLWLKGFIGSMLSRKDKISPFVPLVAELKPDMFVSSAALQNARKQARKSPNERTCVIAVEESTGAKNGIENKLWYFREDIMVNSHHWYWHLEYPNGTVENFDRSGELFYYMHQSMLNRYHAERLSNDLPPIVPLDIKVNGIIADPYYSFLEDTNSNQKWADRLPNSIFKNIKTTAFGNSQFDIKIIDNIRQGKRLFKAARTGYMIMPNGSVPLNLKNINGIDFLGKTAEAITLHSVNPNYYGDWHNGGHLFISFINDPQNPGGLKEVGVMGDTATAMRDVVFYRWHKTVNNLFATHKDTLTPYQPRGGELQLIWPGIAIENFEVISVGRKSVPPLNTMYTFWNERRFDLAKGLDFQRNANINGSVDLCVDHLNHDEFEYTITITKNAALTRPSKATVRIFLAPRINENNKRYTMEEQRKLFFVLDTFTVDNLRTGRNVIPHNSKASALTLEFAKSLNELQNGEFNDKPNCGCGWPHHLLIPKGKPTGMVFDLFAMITNGEEDAVKEDSHATGTCSQGYLYCGRIKEKYPDSKPMGYPFDRKVYTVPDFNGRRPVDNLDEYVKNIPNMKTIQVTIIHEPNRKERAFS